MKTAHYPFGKPKDDYAVTLLPITHVVQTANVTLQQALDKFGEEDDVWTSDFETCELFSLPD
jgi:hypothetical protein